MTPPGERDQPDMATLAASFQQTGAEYDRYRPSFPTGALDLLAPQTVDNAVDLGAGTGKFTELLLARARTVVAVEPSQAMLDVLTERLPGVRAHLGCAEAVPVDASSQDLVTVAQAFHWFERDSACAEISRILRPGAVLGLLWNVPHPGCAWDKAAHIVAHPRLRQRRAIDHPRQDELPGLSIIGADLVHWEERIRLAQVEQILDRDPDTTGRDELILPHTTEVYRYRAPADDVEHPVCGS